MEKNIKEKECYWIPHPSKVYKMVMVRHIKGNQCHATTTDDNTGIDLDIPDCPFYPVNSTSVDDMTALPYLHEAGILSNLQDRAQLHRNMPYTYVANVLIAVNPLRVISDPSCESYCNNPMTANPPHPYGIAEFAYCQMALPNIANRSQSIVISGESGAGKTETSKIVLRYLCWRSSQNHPHSSGAKQVNHSKNIDQHLLQSNPVLESFGNAKTGKTNNSSRFGKLLKIQFDRNNSDPNSYHIVSGSIESYLLEKSRVAMHSDDERNFHVFYQLIAGASMALRKKYRLKKAENYRYLNNESATEIEGVDDQAQFLKLKEAMSAVGFTAADQDCVFRTISAVLSLGNVEFIEVPAVDIEKKERERSSGGVEDEGGEAPVPPAVSPAESGPSLDTAAQVAQAYVVDHVAELLGVSRDSLHQLLVEHFIDMSALTSSGKFSKAQEDIHSPRNVTQALYARDAMAKAIYQRLFSWIVRRISESLMYNQGEDNRQLPFISVLDIFGFEDFQTNGLEQLLINYANESLQLLYTKTVLLAEQALFVEEGLTDVGATSNLTSNEGCLEVIATGKKSILSFLDSVCIRPGVEERVFLSLLHSNIKKNPFFPSTKSIDKKEKFRVKHFARPVTYSVGSFIPKNMDIKLAGLDEMLETSTFYSSSKCSLFAGPNTPIVRSRSGSDSTAVLTPSSPPPPGATEPMRSVVPQRRGSMGVAMKHRTVGGTFITQMADLSKLLQSTSCSFVRCIKPNNTMTNGLFDPICVVNQLRCLGIVQTCEVLKVGLPTRIKITEIEDFYRPILTDKLYAQLHALNSPHERSSVSFIQALMWACHIPTDSFRIGKTKVFFKTGKISMLSAIMSTVDADAGVKLNNRLKFYITRIYFRKWMTRYMCENAFLSLFQGSRNKINAASIIQKSWKSHFFSPKRLRRKAVCRKWRVAILAVRCSLVFQEEINLLVESNAMRLGAQAKAAEQMERRQAELELLLEQEEAEMMEAFEANLEHTRDRKFSDATPDSDDEEESEGVSEDGEMEGNFNLALENDDEFPTDLDEFSRSRSHSMGSSRNNSIGGRRHSNTRRGSAGGTTMGLGSTVAQRNASIANFGKTSIASIARSEMDALIAASSLATVSVCLFRWQSIKLFAAFETWLGNAAADIESEAGTGGRRLLRKRSALSRASLSFDTRSSLCNISEVDDEDKGESSTDIFKDSSKDDDVPNLSAIKESIALARQNSGVSKMFSNVNAEDEEDDTDVDESVTSASRRSENESPLDGGLVEDMCFECTERTPVLYCLQCSEEYCKVCSQFVHDYCKHMKTHEVVDIGKKPLDMVQIRPAFSNQNRPPPKTVAQLSAASGADEKPDERPQRRSSRTFKSMGMITGDETGSSEKNHCAIRSCDKPATKGVSIRFCDEHYEEFRSSMKISKQQDSAEGETDAKTLQQTIALLTKQLKESGQQPVEFVELRVARERMQKAVERLMGGEEAAENDIERWDKAIKMNPEYQIEMEEKIRKWEEEQKPINYAAYVAMRKLIPPDLSEASLGSMIEDGLPKTIANRIWTKKILGMICTHEGDIKRIHIVDLQTKYSNQGLDIVEMRAIWHVMPTEFDLDGDGKKAKWRDLFRQKLEELNAKEEGNRLSNVEKRNNAYKGHEDLAIYDPTTEIKKKVIAKSTAFDATEKPDVNSKMGSGIKELRKQMGPEKPIVDGPLVYLSGGSGNPDEGKKVYANLFLQKKKIVLYPNADKAKEEEDCIEEFTIVKEHTIKIGPGSKTFCLMIEDKEVKAFQSDKARRDAWVTALTDIVKVLNTAKKIKKKKDIPEEVAPPVEEDRPPRPSFLDAIGKKGGDRPPAPSFMDAIKNKNKDGAGGERPPAPSFMDAIKNRKAGGGGGGGGGGGDRPAPPSFMDAIKNRKAGGESGGDAKPPAPSFMDAIKNRKPKESTSEEPLASTAVESADAVGEVAKVKKPRKERKEEEI